MNYTSSSASTTQCQNIKSVNVNCGQIREISLLKVLFVLLVYVRDKHKEQNLINKIQALYFNVGPKYVSSGFVVLMCHTKEISFLILSFK